MMTTGKVFGNSNIANRPEFGGIDPRIEVQQEAVAQNLADEQLRLEQNKSKLLQDAITKFLAKEITRAELEVVQESLK
jgi:hypothetical protein